MAALCPSVANESARHAANCARVRRVIATRTPNRWPTLQQPKLQRRALRPTLPPAPRTAIKRLQRPLRARRRAQQRGPCIINSSRRPRQRRSSSSRRRRATRPNARRHGPLITPRWVIRVTRRTHSSQPPARPPRPPVRRQQQLLLLPQPPRRPTVLRPPRNLPRSRVNYQWCRRLCRTRSRIIRRTRTSQSTRRHPLSRLWRRRRLFLPCVARRCRTFSSRATACRPSPARTSSSAGRITGRGAAISCVMSARRYIGSRTRH